MRWWAGPLAALVLFTTPGAAQETAPALSPLAFLGFRAGIPVDSIASAVKAAGGGLVCRKATVDPRVRDCRAVIAEGDAPVELWLSAIDGTVAIMTLSTALESNRLDDWRRDLETRYGQVNARAQGPQWMLQWVRRGQMLRLTWRIDGGQKRVSVSLVDGPILDGWSAPRRVSRRAG